MDHETIAALCEAYRGCEASAPFGPQRVVYKVGGKIFALLSLDTPRLNLKCEPELAGRLREEHASVEPGYHMSKKHWNSVYWEREAIPDDLLARWIAHSYGLVLQGLPLRTQKQLAR